MVARPGSLIVRERSEGPPLSYWAFVPRPADRAVTLVLIHGSMRNTGRMFRAFLPAAIELNMPIVIPNFPASGYPAYQRLAGAAGPLAARSALDGTLDDAHDVLGIATATVAMCGFSGGAQFAHRYALFSPGRLQRVVVAAAGHYTYLDESRPYPHGIAPGSRSGHQRPDLDDFLRLPMRVVVGELDVHRGKHLRTGPAVDEAQGNERLTRALRWVDHVGTVAARHGVPSQISFDLLPGTAHSFSSAVHRGDLVSRVLRFVHPPTPPTGDISSKRNQVLS